MDEYFIYLRKSRADMEAEAHGEGETLARHERALLELAKRLHLNVTQIYREVVSGETIAARPVMQRILSEVEQGVWAGGLVMEIERLARGDTIDQGIIAQTFKFSETKIITPMKIYDPTDEYDEEYFEFGLFMSRREYKVINRRLLRGKLAAAKEGKWVPNKPPYGYRRVKLKNEKGFSLEPIEETAAAVRLIYDLYTIGLDDGNGEIKRLGAGSICRYLDDNRISPPEGEFWTRCEIGTILKNPAYKGYVRWGNHPSKKTIVDGVVVRKRVKAPPGEVGIYKGRHPAIVSEEQWNLAQDIRAQAANSATNGDNTLQNPMAGILVCGNCGHTIIRSTSSYRPNGSLKCRTPRCPTVSADMQVVEKRLIEALHEWLRGYELEWEVQPEQKAISVIEVKAKAVARAEADLKKLDKQLERTHDLLEQEVYDVDTFLDRSRALADKIAAAKELLLSLRQELAEEEEREARKVDIIPKVKNLLEVYASLPSAQAKNDLLKEVLEKVVYRKERVPGQKLPADGFELEIYPRIPKK